MARYDLLLTQNRAASGIEFEEMNVNIKKGTLVVGQTNGGDQQPVALDPPDTSNGQVLVIDATDNKGLKWSADTAIASTSNATLEIAKGGHAFKLKAKAAGEVELSNTAEDGLVDLALKGLQITTGYAGTHEVPFLPPGGDNDHALITKAAMDAAIEAGFSTADALVFKGVLTNDPANNGTITSEDSDVNGKNFGALEDYSAGWVIKVGQEIVDHTNFGKLDPNDTIIAKAGGETFNADDWFVVQGNIDAADLVKKSDFSEAHSILTADTANTPTVLNSTSDDDVLRRVGSGNLAFGKILNDNITDDTIALGKMAKIAKNKLIGTPDTGEVPLTPQVIDIGDGLSMSAAGVLTADNTGTVTAVTATSPVASSEGTTPDISLVTGTASVGIDMSHFKHIAKETLIGNATGSTAAPTAITALNALAMLIPEGSPNIDTEAPKGSIRWDDNFIYVCYDTDQWSRAPLARTWVSIGE